MNVGRFYPSNNEYDEKYSKLRNGFRARMNGATEGQMKSRGIKYRVNFGVSVPHIKELSARFSFSPMECERLWFSEIREAMMVAAMQMPDERLDFDTMKEWSSCISNIDIAEQASFFMFGRMKNPARFIQFLVSTGNQFQFAAAFFTAGRAIQHENIPDKQVLDALLARIGENWWMSMAGAARGISFFLRQALRKGCVSRDQINSVINSCLAGGAAPCIVLAEELRTELDFLDEK